MDKILPRYLFRRAMLATRQVLGFVFFLTASWLLLTVPVKAQGAQPVKQEWAKQYSYNHLYGTPFEAKPVAIVVDKYSNTYVTGNVATDIDTVRYYDPEDGYYAEYLDPVYDYGTIKYDPQGNQLWVSLYNGPHNYKDKAVGIAVDGQGNVFVTGESYPNSSLTIKYSSQGEEIWKIANPDGVAQAIAVDVQGNIYVVGSGDDVIKYDTNGILLWKRSYEKAIYGSIGKHIAIDKEGNIYVTGNYHEFTTSNDIITSKYDAQGNRLWVQRYHNGGKYNLSGSDEVHNLVLDEQGNVYIIGNSYFGGGTIIIKYDNQGNQLWLTNVLGYMPDYKLALAVDKQGNVILTGASTIYTKTKIVKLDNQGHQIWLKTTDTSRPAGVVLDKEGNLYIGASKTIDHGEYNSAVFVTSKYTTQGDSLWSITYASDSQSYASATNITLDETGNVYVTGSSKGNDFTTVKYSQTAPLCTASGSILQEIWLKAPGYDVRQIPVANSPQNSRQLPRFEGWSNLTNNYGDRISGYICPPTSGNYTFWIASDDNGALFLSADDQPSKKQRIAWVNGATKSREWTKFASQKSAPIYYTNSGFKTLAFRRRL